MSATHDESGGGSNIAEPSVVAETSLMVGNGNSCWALVAGDIGYELFQRWARGLLVVFGAATHEEVVRAILVGGRITTSRSTESII